MTLLEKMNQGTTFSEAEQNIVSYLLEHMNQISDMTLEQLAKKAYVSNATIIRMCQKLGFKGYKQFKIQFVKECESAKYLADSVDFSVPFGGMEDSHAIMNRISNLYKESIDLCLQRIDPDVIADIAKVMVNASRIFIFAEGDTMFTVKGFINKLLKLNIYPILASETFEDVATSCNIRENDCVMFISYSFKSSRFTKFYQLIKNRPIDIITITANEKHMIAKMSKYRLIVADKENNHKIATFYSQFVFDYLLNILYSMIYANDYQKNHVHKEIVDRLNQ
ncbi:MAG: MurR/RpiR family transcriptional regulator [Eubacteriales bacterium]|nr:MurR/RpiR family transcriptional regulator [Eubacteriales bacterium]